MRISARMYPLLSSIVLLALASSTFLSGQEGGNENQKDESRDIGYNYAAARESSAGSKPAPSNRRYERRTPPLKSAEAKPSPKGSNGAMNSRAELTQIGLTTWLLRPAKATDEKRTVFQDAKTSEAFTPVRAEVGHMFAPGDRIRLSMESPREGYLYIVDREIFADGTTGPAYLVFPTLGIRGGNNLVGAGVLTDLPSPEEPPLRLQPSGDNVVGELFTFVFSSKPLLIPPLGQNSSELPGDIFSNWVKWEVQTETYELVGGAGSAWTVAEKNAAAGAKRLKATDPLPQSTFRLRVPSDQPVLVNLALRYRQAK